MPRGRPRKNAQVIMREPFDADATIDGSAIKEVAREAKIEQAERNMEVINSLNEFTKSKLYHLNYLIHDFKELSAEPSDWIVSMYYPAAATGPTFVDFPKNDRQLLLCQKKAEIMKKKNKRYLVFMPDEMPTEERFGEA